MAINKQVIEFQGKGVARLKKQYAELESRTRRLETSTKGGSKALGGMVAQLGLTTAALYGTMRAISGVISVGRDFGKNMSNVAAISGATGKELQSLERNAMELGSTTVFTASQVALLQTEFAKLGFTSKEIRGVTKDTLALAAASGADLATSAAVAGQTLRAFGLDVTETARVTDTMAASFSSSALDMDKFSNSMQYVAPVAKQVGISVEATTAVLGTLANAGISGSMAGTSLRRILLELGNESSKLSKAIGFPVKSADDLQRAFLKLSAEGLGTAEMKELVGQRAISAFGILLDGVDDTNSLTESLKNAGGAAQQMAEVQLDNLDGSLTLLNSAMEGLGLRLFDFVGGPLRSMVDSTTRLTNLIDEDTINALFSYAVAIGGVTIAMKGYSAAALLARSRTLALSAAMAKSPAGLVAVGMAFLAGKTLEMSGVLRPSGDIVDTFNEKLDNTRKSADNAKKAINALSDASLNAAGVMYDIGAAGDDVVEAFLEGEEVFPTLAESMEKSVNLAKDRMDELRDKTFEFTPTFVEQTEIIGQSIAENMTAKLQEFADQHIETIESVAMVTDELMNVSNAYTGYYMQDIDNRRQKEIDAAMSSTLDEEQKQARIQNIKEKYAKEERNLRRAQKGPMMAQAIANTSLGVARAFGDHPFPLSGVIATLVAAAGAFEVATIASQQFAQGGIVQGNPSAGDVVPIRATAGELILNQAQQDNLAGGMGTNITVNISAPLVDDTVVDRIIPAINQAVRSGTAELQTV